MTSYFVQELKLLINYGVKENEKISKVEKLQRYQKFVRELSVEKYYDLFISIQDYLLNVEASIEDKQIVIMYLLELINSYAKLQNNIKNFPNIIVLLYNSYERLFQIHILFEQICNLEDTAFKDFEEIIEIYLAYLDDPLNEFYIYYQYDEIVKFNESIFSYLNKKDSNGIKNSENINSNILKIFYEKINVSKSR